MRNPRKKIVQYLLPLAFWVIAILVLGLDVQPPYEYFNSPEAQSNASVQFTDNSALKTVIQDNETLRLVSLNVENYFNGEVLPSGEVSFRGSRGVRNNKEYQEKRSQLLSWLKKKNADVIALIEVENDLHKPQPAIDDLLRYLNVEGRSYKVAVNQRGQKTFGSDAITQYILYDANRIIARNQLLSFFSKARSNSNTSFGRPTLLQKFSVRESQLEPFFVAVSHLKSKSGGCKEDRRNDPPCDLRRLNQVTKTNRWIEKSVGNVPVVWVGDFNALPKEKPVQWLLDKGWNTPLSLTDDYSYRYRGKPQLIDYGFHKNFHVKTTKIQGRIAHLNGPAARRFSDHDSVILELKVHQSDN